MTIKEKAKELVDKFRSLSIVTDYNSNDHNEVSKQCALISVDEILGIMELWGFTSDAYFLNTLKYWKEVKTEIEKI